VEQGAATSVSIPEGGASTALENTDQARAPPGEGVRSTKFDSDSLVSEISPRNKALQPGLEQGAAARADRNLSWDERKRTMTGRLAQMPRLCTHPRHKNSTSEPKALFGHELYLHTINGRGGLYGRTLTIVTCAVPAHPSNVTANRAEAYYQRTREVDLTQAAPERGLPNNTDNGRDFARSAGSDRPVGAGMRLAVLSRFYGHRRGLRPFQAGTPGSEGYFPLSCISRHACWRVSVRTLFIPSQRFFTGIGE